MELSELSVMIRRRGFSLGNMLSGSWAICKGHFTTILAITLIIYIPINFVLSLLPNDTLIDGQGLGGSGQYLQLAQALEALFGVLAIMAIAFVVEHSLTGESIGYRKALRLSFSRWGSVIGTSMLAGLILLGLTLLLIVPGIIWGVYYTFFVYVVALRSEGGKSALDYSKSLVKGHWWKVAGITAVLATLVGISAWIIMIPFWFTPQNVLIDVISFTLVDII